ncbi:MAG: hypothetical protein M1476_02145 [Candidatus Thermoplasmatota archaeon]|nr:hypothetical protein [Candidatus Thermoplasmatota archaeon]
MPENADQLPDTVFEEVKAEIIRAHSKYGKFNSTHEAYAVILEETEELWETIRKKEPKQRTYEEAIQVAAATIALIIDLLH